MTISAMPRLMQSIQTALQLLSRAQSVGPWTGNAAGARQPIPLQDAEISSLYHEITSPLSGEGPFGLERLFVASPGVPVGGRLSCQPNFEAAVKEALQSGFFNQVFGVEESLELAEVQPAAERHCYFTVYDVDMRPNATTITLSVFVKATDKTIVEEFRSIELEGKYRGNLRRLYGDLSERICDFIDKEQRLFTNQTRCVVLRGATSQSHYKIYYKFGKSSGMELLSSDILRQLGFRVPTVYPGSSGDYVWIEDIGGQTWNMVIESLFEEENRGGEQASHFAPIPPVERAFFKMGQLTALMFLLGNGDFHGENLLWVDNYEPAAIDFETIGEDLYSGEPDRAYQESIKQSHKYLKDTMAFRWRLLDGLVAVDYPRPLKIARVRGIQSFFEMIDRQPMVLRALLAPFGKMGSGDLYTRVPLRNTSAYRYKYGETFPIPHCSFRVPITRLRTLFEDRINMVSSFIQEGWRLVVARHSHPAIDQDYVTSSLELDLLKK